MILALYIIIAIVLLYIVLHFSGMPTFWKLTRKHPVEAYDFFLSNDCWFVVDGVNNTEPPKDRKNWDGPFTLFLPNIKNRIKVYGKSPYYEKSQEEFVRLYK